MRRNRVKIFTEGISFEIRSKKYFVGNPEWDTLIWSDVELNIFVYNKLPLYILYYLIRNNSILLTRNVNMRQLWLSSPALGSWIPNLGRFLASNKLTKIHYLVNNFIGKRSPSCKFFIQILASVFQSEGSNSFLKCEFFWPCYLI